MAEAAIYREGLRSDASSSFEPEHIAGAALLPVTGKHKAKADVALAVAAEPAETSGDLRSVKRDQAMTTKAFNVLESGEPDAYSRALAALRDDTRAYYWSECMQDRPSDGLRHEPTVEALKAWIEVNGSKCRSPSLSIAMRSEIRCSVQRMVPGGSM